MDAQSFKAALMRYLAQLHNDTQGIYTDSLYNNSVCEGFTDFSEPQQVLAQVVTVENVESETGGEDYFPHGEGAVYYVMKVTSDDSVQYFKLNGIYQSYSGVTWNDDWVEVHPKKVEVTVYE